MFYSFIFSSSCLSFHFLFSFSSSLSLSHSYSTALTSLPRFPLFSSLSCSILPFSLLPFYPFILSSFSLIFLSLPFVFYISNVSHPRCSLFSSLFCSTFQSLFSFLTSSLLFVSFASLSIVCFTCQSYSAQTSRYNVLFMTVNNSNGLRRLPGNQFTVCITLLGAERHKMLLTSLGYAV